MMIALCDGSKCPNMLRDAPRLQPSCGRPSNPSKNSRFSCSENAFQIEVLPLRTREELSSPDLLHQMRLPPYIAPVQVKTVAVRMQLRYEASAIGASPAKYLPELPVLRRGSPSQQIGHPDLKSAFRQSYETVRIREPRQEFHRDGWNRSARLQLVKYPRIDLLGSFKKKGTL